MCDKMEEIWGYEKEPREKTKYARDLHGHNSP